MTVVGIVSPGEMGSALGAALRAGGARVVATVSGRSGRTARLAGRAGLELLGDLDDVVRTSDVLLSVAPPQEAEAIGADLVARARRAGVRPVLADLNAVSPEQVRAIDRAAAAAGLAFADGALSGAPPAPGRVATRLLLAGDGAAAVAALPWQDVAPRVVGAEAGAASAVKMCTGAVRKGVTALVVNALSTAAAHDVVDVVEAELRHSLGRDPLVEVELAAAKAWRFVPEMEAVAATQAAAGLDPDLYRALADVFRRLAGSPLAGSRPEDVERRAGDAAARRAAIAAALRPAQS